MNYSKNSAHLRDLLKITFLFLYEYEMYTYCEIYCIHTTHYCNLYKNWHFINFAIKFCIFIPALIVRKMNCLAVMPFILTILTYKTL